MRSRLFQARSFHQTVLVVDPLLHKLVHVEKPNVRHRLAHIYISVHSSAAFILFDNPEMVPFAPDQRSPNGPIIVVDTYPFQGDVFAFRDPSHHTYLTPASPPSEEGVGSVLFYGTDPGEWERFRLSELTTGDFPKSITHQILLIEHAIATPVSRILDLLQSLPQADRNTLAFLLTEARHASDVELFVRSLLHEREKLAEFASLFPGDPWAETRFPALRTFIEHRRTGEPAIPSGQSSSLQVIGPELDQIALYLGPRKYESFPHRCTIAMRRTVVPPKTVCIVATARDDGLYILEWLAYHKAIGVERIFLYTNDNIDGSDELLRVLARADEISLIESTLSPSSVSPVAKAYGHALSVAPEVLDYRWCAIIDSDEMIGLDKTLFRSLRDYLAWQELEPVDAIALSWMVFGSSGQMRWEDQFLMHRFKARYPDPHIKSLFRPREFHYATPHVPFADRAPAMIARDAAGQRRPLEVPYTAHSLDAPAWIAHYFFRSFEEYVWKFSRGRGDQPIRHGQSAYDVPPHFMEMFIKQTGEIKLTHDDRMTAFADEMEAETLRLKAIPNVQEALNAVRKHYLDRSRLLKPRVRQQRETASDAARAFYDLLLNSGEDC